MSRFGIHVSIQDRIKVSPGSELWRVKAFSWVVLALYGSVEVGVIFNSNMIFSGGYSWRPDFISYWLSAKMALTGHLADSYHLESMQQAFAHYFPDSWGLVNFNVYPPVFYLWVSPLAMLPLVPAYLVFMGVTFWGYGLTLGKIIPLRYIFWPLVAFPGVWATWFQGQNSFLTALLAAAVILLLERGKEISAGVLAGLLIIKPHLLIGILLLMIFRRKWKLLVVAFCMALVLTGVAEMVFGSVALLQWIQSMKANSLNIEDSTAVLQQVPTPFAYMRLIGASLAFSYLVQGIVAVLVIALLGLIISTSNSWALIGSAVMISGFLVSPYFGIYDLAWLAFPLAWLSSHGLKNGWPGGLKPLLGILWIMPLVFQWITVLVPTFIVPFVLMISLVWIWRQCQIECQPLVENLVSSDSTS
ncbi:MAG: DUF2029 domain-containing protein [Ferrovum sp.]|nr:DUF2029 domain-containing protein [Ferrovum sp.]NDU87094.1 DUF2029 domain-containing protein [Ferrovum sp.]